jgi:hypothetical protein
MAQLSIEEVLPDARLVARHAFRSGRLPKGSKIFDEIDRATQALEAGARPSAVPLNAEKEAVLEDLGITLEQLQRRETRLGRFSHRAAQITPYLIGLLTLLLTLYLSFQSSELHKADLALREYQELVSERLPEKVYFAWKMYRYERVLNVQAPTLAHLDGYQKLVHDAKRLFGKLVAVRAMLVESAVIRYVPALFQTYGPCWSQGLSKALNSDSNGPSAECASPADAISAVGGLREEVAPVLDCPKLPDGVKGKLAVSDAKVDLEAYEGSIACFVKSLQIDQGYSLPLDEFIYATRNKVFLLVSWMLPGLYGLLGACVFLMRRLLFVNDWRNGQGDARIVDLLSLVLRIALGGLAGIIIGWFWVPTALTTNSSAIAVSSVSFGVAFLAGFSIDSVFTLLDKMNRAMGATEGKDKDTAAEPSTRWVASASDPAAAPGKATGRAAGDTAQTAGPGAAAAPPTGSVPAG